MLMRQKIVLLLLVGIPTLFIFIVQLTGSARDILFEVGIAETKTMIKATEANVSLIFVSMAIIGFLSSFVSLSLVQQYKSVNRRLVICGYYPVELMLSALTVMFFIIVLLVLCIGFSMQFFFQPLYFWPMLLGMLFNGLIYGGYGMLVGYMTNGALEGTLTVILLANIDAGWLQNPLILSEARNKIIIQLLPAYYPTQLSVGAAFADVPLQRSIFICLAYMLFFFGAAFLISYYDMRIKQVHKIKKS
jgi:hypothetical protein